MTTTTLMPSTFYNASYIISKRSADVCYIICNTSLILSILIRRKSLITKKKSNNKEKVSYQRKSKTTNKKQNNK